jgi:hypothetical protein
LQDANAPVASADNVNAKKMVFMGASLDPL